MEDLVVHAPYNRAKTRSEKNKDDDDAYDVRGEITAETIKLNKAPLSDIPVPLSCCSTPSLSF